MHAAHNRAFRCFVVVRASLFSHVIPEYVARAGIPGGSPGNGTSNSISARYAFVYFRETWKSTTNKSFHRPNRGMEILLPNVYSSFESVVWKIDRLMDQFRNWKCGSSSNCEIGIIFHLYCYPLIDNYILRIDSHQSDRKDKLPTYIFRTILKYQIIRWYYPRGNWKFSFQSFLDLNRSIGIVRKGSVRRNPDGWLVSSVGLIVGPR